MNEKQYIAEKVLEEVVKSQIIEDDFLKGFEFTPYDFYTFFESVMNYAGGKDLLEFKYDYYSLEQTSMEYEGHTLIFSELSSEKDRQAFSIELAKDTEKPKFTYEDFKNTVL